MAATPPPPEAGAEAERLALTGLKLDVADLDVVDGGDNPAWRADPALALKRVTAAAGRPLPISASVDDVALTRLAASSDRQLAVGAPSVGRFDMALSPPPRSTVAEPVPAAAATAREASPWPPADLPALATVAVAEPAPDGRRGTAARRRPPITAADAAVPLAGLRADEPRLP